MAALGQAEADARVSTAVPPAEALKHMFMYKALRMNGKKYSSSIGYFTCGTLACVQTWETQRTRHAVLLRAHVHGKGVAYEWSKTIVAA